MGRCDPSHRGLSRSAGTGPATSSSPPSGEYWQRRNRAAQVQKARQDRLGHRLGEPRPPHLPLFTPALRAAHRGLREARLPLPRAVLRRAAGGVGAQVLEQPNAGVVIFADVDLSPDELLIDFAHEPLPEREQLGTVGLWCALHGESFLEAGHAPPRMPVRLRAPCGSQLEAEAGVRTMKPFTDFPYLRQAFTEGERWPVREERIATSASDRPDHAGAGRAVPQERRDRLAPGKPRAERGVQGLQPERRERDHRRHRPAAAVEVKRLPTKGHQRDTKGRGKEPRYGSGRTLQSPRSIPSLIRVSVVPLRGQTSFRSRHRPPRRRAGGRGRLLRHRLGLRLRDGLRDRVGRQRSGLRSARLYRL